MIQRFKTLFVVCSFSLMTFLGIFFSYNKSKSRSLLEVKRSLACIPKEDRLVLSSFFRALVQKFCAGHVLYGSKPMCFVGYHSPQQHCYNASRTLSFHCLASLQQTFTRHDLMMEMGLFAWKKYASFFPMKHFALIDHPESNGTVTILLINKGSFLQKIEEQLKEFERFYSKKITAQEILDQVLNRDPNFFKMFHKNEVMKGILLGYGTNNAKIFARKLQIWNELGEIKHRGIKHKIAHKEFRFCSIKPSHGFNSLEEELSFLDEKTKYTSKPGCNFNFTPNVGFIADPQDPETIQLTKRYHLEKKQIPHIYSQGDFLHTTLCKLVEQ